MKPDTINPNRSVTYGAKEQTQSDKTKEVKNTDTRPNKLSKEPSKRIELDEAVINNPEAVKKLAADSIQWREMKFYQRKEGGQVYIDVIDKATGNVIRTIPDNKMGEVSEKLKQYGAGKINING